MSVLDTFTDYTYFYELTVPACTAGDEIQLNLGNLTTTPGLISWGYVREDLKDARIAYWNGSVYADVGRTIMGDIVFFLAQATEASETVGTYVAYFGHATEDTAPSESESAILVSDTFADSSLSADFNAITEGTGALTETTALAIVSNANADVAVLNLDGALPASFGLRAVTRCTNTTSVSAQPMLMIMQSSTDPTDRTDWANTTINPLTRFRVSLNYASTNYRISAWYVRTDGTIMYWDWVDNHWQTDTTNIYYDLGASRVNVRAELSKVGTTWTCNVYNDDTGALIEALTAVTDVKDDTNSLWHVAGDVFDSHYIVAHTHTLCQAYAGAVPPSISSTREVAKQNAVKSDSLVLDSSNVTNETTEYAFGADQATGRGLAIPFTPSETGDYQCVEVLVRQRDTTNIVARDMVGEVWADSAGSPGAVIGRGRISTLGAESSTGDYQWLRTFLPSKLSLTGSTQYWFVPVVNGAGSSTQALNFGCEDVASGGTLQYRTRAASAWGAWSADTTKNGCIRVYRGWPALPGRRVSLVDRDAGNPCLEPGTPSWEATYPEQDMTHIHLAQATGGKALYASYDDDADYGVVNSRNIGAATYSDPDTFVKYDQDPLIAHPVTDPVTTEHATPWIYDWTANAAKMYYRVKLASADALGRIRFISHATNTHANWYQPGSGGGWASDGAVTYPWPVCEGVYQPGAWVDGETTYVMCTYDLDQTVGELRALVAEKLTDTTIGNARPVYMDLSDQGVARMFVYPSQQTSDGYRHSPVSLQTALAGDSAGTWVFDLWVASTLDGSIFSPPYPILPRDSSIASEYLGCDVGVFADDAHLLYAGIIRYLTTVAPHVQVVGNLAHVALVSATGMPLMDGFERRGLIR